MDDIEKLKAENARLKRALIGVIGLYLDEDEVEWKETDSFFYVGGSKSSYRCECGCNIFRSSVCEKKAKCNSCEAIYNTEAQ